MDFSNVLTDTYTLILLIVLAVAFVFLMLYYGFVVMRVGLYKNKKIPKQRIYPMMICHRYR